MATVSDILKKVDDTLATSTAVVFKLYDGPHCRTDAVTSKNRVSVTTHATTAAFSTALREGIYDVFWRISQDFSNVRIYVPAGSATYDLNAIQIVEDADATNVNVFNDWAAFQAALIPTTTQVVMLRETEDEARDIFFIRSIHADALSATPDGVNLIADSIGQRFVRQGVNPDDLA